MDLFERSLYLAVGGSIGFVLGYIVGALRDIKRELDEVDTIVTTGVIPESRQERNKGWHPSITHIYAFAVLCLAVFATFASQKASHDLAENNQQDTVDLCRSGQDTRKVQRATVEAVYTLATGALKRPPGSPPLTSEEVKQYNAYIKRVNTFRTEMYELIKPSDLCAPYVEDDDIKPPGGPYPRLTNRSDNNVQQ